MIKEVTAVGKSIIEAQETARAALGVGPLDDVKFEVLHYGSKGIFGIIGVKPAKVRAYIELPDAEEKRKRHDKPKKENRQNNNGGQKNNSNKQKAPRPEKVREEKKEAAPKSVAIPEAELKLERREVSTGEDMSFDFVRTVIADIGLNAEATLYSCEDGTRRIVIDGEDASTLIGHHGDTLDALQYLANLACARKNINGERDKSRVTIDIEGYRAKREETLRALARRMAAKALRNRRSVMLEPMSAYERRIIHSEIQNIEGVSTNSVGSDNNRKIVIFLTDKRPKGVFEEDKETEVSEAAAESMATETVEAETEAATAEE
ncbi:MAG: Jag N-terminal domain-containing protein [Clostridia bacterium]|nr:Jag N-terminal domain-containing protein [Clostridia bacterium]